MSIARWFTNPRFFMAPIADGGEGEGGGDEGGEGEDLDGADGGEGEGGEEEAPAKGEKPKGEKGGKEKPPAKPKAGEKGKEKPAAKGKDGKPAGEGEKGKKGEEKPAAKTLLGGKGKPAVEEGGEGEGEADGEEADGDLEAWTPKLADGVKVDEELLGDLKGIGKKLNLKGEQLQGIVELGTKMQGKVSAALVQAHEEHVEGLAKQARADKEIGGSKLEGVVANGLAVLKAHGGQDFDTLVAEVERTGLGSHPAFLKFLNRIHESTKEDDTVARTGRGAGGAPAKKSFTEKMYPKMAKELAKQRGEDADD